jgi:hypothetical protein
MKTLLLLCACLLRAGGSHAQSISSDQVPPLTFAALQQHHPQATQLQWKKAQGLYQASFTEGQAQQLVRFNNSGDVEATGVPLPVEALPAAVRQTLTDHFPSRKVCQAFKFVNARTEDVTYETATCETGFSQILVFTADGRKVRRTSNR